MITVDVSKSRFRDADWFTRINSYDMPIIVGGAGGIGSWLSLFLSRMLGRESSIILYDNDTVEEVNLAGQFFGRDDVRKLKTLAVKDKLSVFSGYNGVEEYPVRYEPSTGLKAPVMFSCFDNMKARKDFFSNWKQETLINDWDKCIFIDGRLLAEQLQVFYVTPERIDKYEKYLFDDKDVPDTSCSYKQTSHFAATIAAKMVQGLTLWMTDPDSVPFYYEEIGSLFLNATRDE